MNSAEPAPHRARLGEGWAPAPKKRDKGDPRKPKRQRSGETQSLMLDAVAECRSAAPVIGVKYGVLTPLCGCRPARLRWAC